MANENLTAQYLREILHYDPETGAFRWARPRPKIVVGTIAGTPAAKGHVAIKIDGKSYKAHRLAWLYVTGEWPKDQIDHKNRVPNDNRFDNLRDCTTAVNCQNQGIRKNNTSGYQGVSFNKSANRWRAMINVNRKFIVLGLFSTAKEAGEAYAAAKKQLHIHNPDL